MKENKIIVLKVAVFKFLKPLERIFAYNRMRRDGWLTKQANMIAEGSKVLDIGAGGCPQGKSLIIVSISLKTLFNYQIRRFKIKRATER